MRRSLCPILGFVTVLVLLYATVYFLSATKHQDNVNEVRVLVMVMTTAKNLGTSALAVYETWGKRCDKILFFSSGKHSIVPTIDLKSPEGLENLNEKMMDAFRYIHENHYNDFDWFMKADDDTYVIVENLKRFLASKNTRDPVYFGQRFRTEEGIEFHGGGAGYVMSKEALRRLASTDSLVCMQTGDAEDWNLGQCMKKIGVEISSGNDEHGKSLFHSFNLSSHLQGRFEKWYPKYAIDNKDKSPESISQYPITFHRVKEGEARTYDYLLYKTQPYRGK